MDENIKLEMKPTVLYESDCDKIELEMLGTADEIDRMLAEKDAEIAAMEVNIDGLTNHADNVDYALAVASGVLTGLIDAAFVGESKLKSVDQIIKEFAKSRGWEESSRQSAQNFLVGKYHTSNDAAYQKGEDILGHKLNVGGKTHRFDEIAHHPTIEGLLATIIVRFARVTMYIEGKGKGHIVAVKTEKNDMANLLIPAIITGFLVWLANTAESYNEENCGSKIPAEVLKLVKLLHTVPAIIEILKSADIWLGHIMSDVATPAGISGIFLSFLKTVSALPLIEKIPLSKDGKTTLPMCIEKLYKENKFSFSEELPALEIAFRYTMPTIINETLVRSFYFVRQLINEYKEQGGLEGIDWQKTIPFGNRTIERMMTISTGVFFAVDSLDAVIRGIISGSKAGAGFWAEFGRQVVLRLNFVGIGRFTIALGTEAIMGLKKGKYTREQMLLKNQALFLAEAKIYQGEKLLWEAVEDAESSIGSLEEAMARYSMQVVEDLNRSAKSLKEIKSISFESIDESNSGLLDEIADLL